MKTPLLFLCLAVAPISALAQTEISSRTTKTNTEEVRTIERVDRVILTRESVEMQIGTYTVLSDGTAHRVGVVNVSRPRAAVAAETVTIGGNNVTAAQVANILGKFADKWRAEDIAAAEAAAQPPP